MGLTNLVGINEEIETSAVLSNDDRCKVAKWHLTRPNNGWSTEADFLPDLFLPFRLAGGVTELAFRENLVRFESVTVREGGEGVGGGLATGTPHWHTGDGGPYADYSGEWLEVWFSNECREVAGLTAWGSYSYGRWWKGLALQYPKDCLADHDHDGEEGRSLFSYAELEHEAAGPTLAVGLWRVEAGQQGAGEAAPCLQLCFAKAKAFGIKRIVHNISIPYTDLIGKRTTITWVHD